MRLLIALVAKIVSPHTIGARVREPVDRRAPQDVLARDRIPGVGQVLFLAADRPRFRSPRCRGTAANDRCHRRRPVRRLARCRRFARSVAASRAPPRPAAAIHCDRESSGAAAQSSATSDEADALAGDGERCSGRGRCSPSGRPSVAASPRFRSVVHEPASDGHPAPDSEKVPAGSNCNVKSRITRGPDGSVCAAVAAIANRSAATCIIDTSGSRGMFRRTSPTRRWSWRARSA